MYVRIYVYICAWECYAFLNALPKMWKITFWHTIFGLVRSFYSAHFVCVCVTSHSLHPVSLLFVDLLRWFYFFAFAFTCAIVVAVFVPLCIAARSTDLYNYYWYFIELTKSSGHQQQPQQQTTNWKHTANIAHSSSSLPQFSVWQNRSMAQAVNTGCECKIDEESLHTWTKQMN